MERGGEGGREGGRRGEEKYEGEKSTIAQLKVYRRKFYKIFHAHLIENEGVTLYQGCRGKHTLKMHYAGDTPTQTAAEVAWYVTKMPKLLATEIGLCIIKPYPIPLP